MLVCEVSPKYVCLCQGNGLLLQPKTISIRKCLQRRGRGRFVWLMPASCWRGGKSVRGGTNFLQPANTPPSFIRTLPRPPASRARVKIAERVWKRCKIFRPACLQINQQRTRRPFILPTTPTIIDKRLTFEFCSFFLLSFHNVLSRAFILGVWLRTPKSKMTISTISTVFYDQK